MTQKKSKTLFLLILKKVKSTILKEHSTVTFNKSTEVMFYNKTWFYNTKLTA